MDKVIKVKGIAVSPGIGIGKVFIKEELPEVERRTIENIDEEIIKIENAFEKVENDLNLLFEEKKVKLGEEKAQIFKAHLMILKDPEFSDRIRKNIKEEKMNAEYANKLVIDEFVNMFESMDDEYFRQRALDIKDIGIRIKSKLLNINTSKLSEVEKGTIVIAKDLTPSDTAQLNEENVSAIITEFGGETSHSAIIANTLGIPGVMGIKNITNEFKNDDLVIVNGNDGTIIKNPDETILNEYKELLIEEESKKELLKEMIGKETISLDGKKIEISANIASLKDIKNALKNDAEGVGLFRSEFIYMENTKLPTEDEQFEIYSEALRRFENKPVVIRTMDIGGDKEVTYLDFEKEMNPFLGYRAIRYCLNEVEVFKTQLKALLRASVYGKLRIMFPMISSMVELKKAKEIFEECKNELKEENITYSDDIEIGIMIEVPTAAIMSDKLAKEVDFFSIGTNDLIQYSTATDRMNANLKDLYTPYNPGVLRLINMTIENAHKEGIWVGMCGSVAGNQDLIPVLLAMGLDEFSMAPTALLKSRKLINSLNIEELQVLRNKVLDAADKNEIKAILNVN
ncbi:phosphoenolpyruvate--protein phosphotransferase [Clostridiaceae bacterium HSG29]|nr:phosphoenolpyruvate--protein phosphotransferase [Clostridiaceae bacterium HSG29]